MTDAPVRRDPAVEEMIQRTGLQGEAAEAYRAKMTPPDPIDLLDKALDLPRPRRMTRPNLIRDAKVAAPQPPRPDARDMLQELRRDVAHLRQAVEQEPVVAARGPQRVYDTSGGAFSAPRMPPHLAPGPKPEPLPPRAESPSSVKPKPSMLDEANEQNERDQRKVYRPTRTMKAFHESDALVRCLLGPVGCLDKDTEVLTRSGWIGISEWNGQEIAEWDAGDGSLVWRKPKDYIVKECEFFHKFENTYNVDMVLSSEHRVPLYDWEGKFVVKTAADLALKPSRHTVPTTFVSKIGVAMSDDALRLWTMVAADGHYPKDGAQCIVTVRKQRKVERVRVLLDACGLAFTETIYPERPTEVRFAFVRPDFPKHFDDRVYAFSSEQAEIVLDEAMFWDGLHDHAEERIYTSLADQADKFQFLAHLAGRQAHIRVQPPQQEGWAPSITVSVARRGSIKNKTQFRGDNLAITTVPAVDGRKYCFVTGTGFFLARRSGRIFVTGNSGKSTSCAMEIFSRALRSPPIGPEKIRHSRWLVARATYSELRSTTIRTFMYWLGAYGTIVYGSPILYTARQLLPDGTTLLLEVEFLPLDGEGAVARLRSLELTGAWLNEGSMITDNHVLEIVGRLRFRSGDYPKDRQPWRGIIIDSNMPTRRHWIYNLFEERGADNPDIALFKQPPALLLRNDGTYIPNPEAENIENLPDGFDYYFRMVNSAEEKERQKVRVLVLAEYGAVFDGKPIYENMWRQNQHVAPKPIEPMRHVQLVVGLDFGLNPAAVFTQQDPMGGILVLDECAPVDVTFEDFLASYLLPTIARRFTGMSVLCVGDPTGVNRSALARQTAYQILHQANLAAVPAFTNAFTTRRDAVGYFLNRTNGFRIDKRCGMLIEGFDGGYRFKKTSSGSSEEADKGLHSHPHDALQYAALYFYRPQMFAPRAATRATLTTSPGFGPQDLAAVSAPRRRRPYYL